MSARDSPSQDVINEGRQLLDSKDSYSSQRTELLDAVQELLAAVRNGVTTTIKTRQEQLKNLLDESPSVVFERPISLLESNLVDFDTCGLTREEILDLFWEHTTVDLQGLRQSATDNGVEIDAGRYKGDIGNVIANEANRILLSSPEYDQLEEELVSARKELQSEQLINAYRASLSRTLEDYLKNKIPLDSFQVQETLENLFGELYVDDWRKKGLENAIDRFAGGDFSASKIKELGDIFRGEEPEQLCYIPLSNVELESMTPLEIGGVTLYDPSSTSCNIFDRLHEDTAPLEDYIRNKADIIAETTVRFSVTSVGRRRIETRLNRIIDVLNFGKDRNLIRSPFENRHLILRETNNGKVIELFYQLDSRFDSNFMINDQPELIRTRIDLFDRYLLGTRKTELENSIDRSMRWFGHATQSTSPEEQFLKYVIALESLLVRTRSEVKDVNIADRAIQILQVHEESRDWEESIFKDIYDIRSRIVHEGVRNLPEFEYQLDRLRRRTERVITVVASHTEECASVDDVIELTHTREHELREERISQSPVGVGESFSTEGEIKTVDGEDVGLIDFSAKLCDDGRYAYYRGEINIFEQRGPVDQTANYEVHFELCDTNYIGENLKFPEEGISGLFMDSTFPITIQWYGLQESSEE